MYNSTVSHVYFALLEIVFKKYPEKLCKALGVHHKNREPRGGAMPRLLLASSSGGRASVPAPRVALPARRGLETAWLADRRELLAQGNGIVGEDIS